MKLISIHALNLTKLLKTKKINQQCRLPCATSATMLEEEEAATVAPVGWRPNRGRKKQEAVLAERLELSVAISGVWNMLTVELASGRSCRDGASAGSCRTARRGADELLGAVAVLGGSPGAMEKGWAI